MHLFLRIRGGVLRLHGIQQHDALDLCARFARCGALTQLVGNFVRQGSTEAPASQQNRAAVGQLDDLLQVSRRAVREFAFQALHTVDRDVVRQAAH